MSGQSSSPNSYLPWRALRVSKLILHPDAGKCIFATAPQAAIDLSLELQAARKQLATPTLEWA